ncbi:BNA3 (YJL060W) [Zygosaccharomyces parabailii]|uniref:ZYBA0S03-06018g1_1 n=1 Tax=Zygosaccharomyces bailii (strain CLIB 213 / ATCC 58445 / CBS 680 / BCRC 21525 / NBRC 1098 / NCYC 1416 / NRRL Y-2227) TaxID=1333698 RepID=A0A8J2T4I9_ZYGB2|nr:BNA3 (YJL060W) [Zygosaccharomyces parabailii]CDF88964.1 ZYBA0S03-06018g1_1 [Zygosaccharomyces bailii CLIB 213]CDH16048.1 probable kynurenine--oxoglutarate transaminase BNA3 [Zygosaccharomyces bailii ISA1307]
MCPKPHSLLNIIRRYSMTVARPHITPNKYFTSNTAKDVWSLTNEAASAAANNQQNKGRELINLGQGFFSYSPPRFAIEEAQKALEIPLVNQYSPTKGRPSLINALTKLYSPFYGVDLKPENVTVTTGANEGILSSLMGILNAGDEVIVFEPFFDQYIPNIELLGGKVVYVPISPPKDVDERIVQGKDWTIDYEELARAFTDKTKAIILNTPQNPIGKVFTREELTKIGNLCVKNNVVIISDEVYEHLYFTESFTRIATISPEIGRLTLSVGSAGKTFAATGWRIGWVVSLNPELLSYVSKAHTRICFSSPSPIQEAVANSINDALKSDYFESMRKDYIRKFEIFTSAFKELGLPYTVPEGTYFILADFSKINIPEDYPWPTEILNKGKDFRISHWLINELGIVAIPPTEFYIKEHEKSAENMLRFAVCKDDEYLCKAVERLKLLKPYIRK